MRWRKANRNRLRAHGLTQPQIQARRKHRLKTVGWREWLEQVLPKGDYARGFMYQNTLNQDSIFNRIMRGEYQLRSRRIQFTERPMEGSSYQTAEGGRGLSELNDLQMKWNPSFIVVDDIDLSIPPAKPRALHDGLQLSLHCGKETYAHFVAMLAAAATDDAEDSL